MAGVAVRQGLGRDVVAGIVWALLRLGGCMGPGEILFLLKAIGVDVGSSRLYKVLSEYRGRLWVRRSSRGNRTLYCALEEV